MRFLPLLLLLFIASTCTSSPENNTTILPSTMDAGPGEELASGHVYHDANENGNMDSGESGIPEMCIRDSH